MNRSPESRRKMSVLVSLFVASCATTQAAAPPPEAPVKMTCKQPTTTPLQETKEIQTKGGVQILVAMQTFTCEQVYKKSVTNAPIPITEQILGAKSHPGQRYVEITKTPTYAVKPERLKVTLKLVNQLPRVFRGAGAVIQFQVAGKTWAAKQEDYAEFTNIIVPPRGEQQIEIYGPSIDAIPPQANIGLFLYDVVTKTDAAGTPTERQNFEWYYNYTLQTKEETGVAQMARGWEGDLAP